MYSAIEVTARLRTYHNVGAEHSVEERHMTVFLTQDASCEVFGYTVLRARLERKQEARGMKAHGARPPSSPLPHAGEKDLRNAAAVAELCLLRFALMFPCRFPRA